MLYNSRADLVFTNNQVWQYEIARSGLDPKRIKFIYKIPDVSSELFLAASLKTDKKIVEKLSNALNTIKADGRYRQLMKQWKL